MAVTAIVVNYNAGDLLGACVQSLIDNRVTDIRVVDNASTDGSLARLQGRYGSHGVVHTLANPTNRGFGPAVNDLLPALERPFVLVMNPDCRLDVGALDTLRAALEADPDAALAGPAVRDRRGRLEAAACRRFPTPRRSFMTASGLSRFAGRVPALAGVTEPGAAALREPTPVEATSGACMLLRRDPFRAAGGFDEGYTLHCEDLDLMRRLQDAGWRVLFVPGAGAAHVQGVSSASRPLWVHRQKHRGMVRFFRQHEAGNHGPLTRLLVHVGIWTHWLLLWPLRWLGR